MIPNMTCVHMQINRLWGAGGAKHKARMGSQIKLKIVTLSTAELFPENNPLR